MATLKQAEKAAMHDIHLLRWLVVQSGKRGIDRILRTKADPPIVLRPGDLATFARNTLTKKMTITAKDLVAYYDGLERQVASRPPLQRDLKPPPTWRG
jgi:hypothetical protein